MGQRPRRKPKYLAAKLLFVRQIMGLSQSQLAAELNISSPRISEYEHGTREPNLLTLLAYARLTGLLVDELVDDQITFRRFGNALFRDRARLD